MMKHGGFAGPVWLALRAACREERLASPFASSAPGSGGGVRPASGGSRVVRAVPRAVPEACADGRNAVSHSPSSRRVSLPEPPLIFGGL